MAKRLTVYVVLHDVSYPGPAEDGTDTYRTRDRRARVALLDSATDAADVYAWLLEAAIADAVTPGVDIDPSSDTGALVIEAANRRLLGRAMGRTLYEVFTREAGAPAMGR